MAGDVEIHEGVGVGDGEGRTDKDAEELVAGETLVLPTRVGCFPFSHPLEALEDDAGVMGDDDAFVAEFFEEAAIATVDRIRYSTEVMDVVVERVSVDMVDGVAFGDQAFEGQVLKAGEVHTAVTPTKC